MHSVDYWNKVGKDNDPKFIEISNKFKDIKFLIKIGLAIPIEGHGGSYITEFGDIWSGRSNRWVSSLKGYRRTKSYNKNNSNPNDQGYKKTI